MVTAKAKGRRRLCRDCGSPTRPASKPGPRCATCYRVVLAARRRAAHEKRVQGMYGLQPGEYEDQLEYQDGYCFICLRARGGRRRLAVDHHHGSGTVRALICGPCNKMLAHARDSVEVFYRAILVLEDPPAVRNLGVRIGVPEGGAALEVWRDIPGFAGWYQASTEGRVRSWRGHGHADTRRRAEPHILGPKGDGAGYLGLGLTFEGTVHQVQVHRLVLETFTAPPPGAQGCHRNGDRSDNALKNLYWGTQEQNAVELFGSLRVDAELTEDLVREARALWDAGDHTIRDLSDIYGVTGSTICRVVTRKTWTHVVERTPEL